MENVSSSRRKFVGALAAGASGLLTVTPVAGVKSEMKSPHLGGDEVEAWLDKIKGEHRIVYDATEPHEGFPMIWSWVYYKTNNDTGVSDDDLTAVVVLRHNAIPFAMEDRLWAKYKLGEMFKINDNNTGAPSLRNPYWIPGEKDYPLPGIDGTKRLMERGALFCVCNMAISVYSSMAAQSMQMDPEAVRTEWLSAVLPGIQVVPSGVWAVCRIQEKDCAYCYAGG